MTGSLTDYQITTLLTSEVIGHLGCGGNDQLYVVPIVYAYDAPYLYSHTHEGMKIALMRKHPNVCVQIEQIDNLANWRSVIVWGKFEELRGTEAEAGLQHLKNRLYPLTSSRYSQSVLDLKAEDVAQVRQSPEVIYRIRIERQSGRFERT
ncbi:MAG: pyridoxamine 5'-phosphate oxidase family protein [Cyclobacteriaceae bacterium]